MIPDHITRMGVELDELETRIDKLSAFCADNHPEICTDPKVSSEDWNLMIDQLHAMRAYAHPLARRYHRALMGVGKK